MQSLSDVDIQPQASRTDKRTYASRMTAMIVTATVTAVLAVVASLYGVSKQPLNYNKSDPLGWLVFVGIAVLIGAIWIARWAILKLFDVVVDVSSPPRRDVDALPPWAS
jgi:protein-S-isoprenylcysteine O-methyltransferase Ste14